jgi:hypothetical protein
MQGDLFDAPPYPQGGNPDGTLWLYVIHATGTRAIKIGCSEDVERRLAELQPGCPQPLQVLCMMPCDNALALEQLLHKRFARQHLRGEWFELPAEVPQAVDVLAYIMRYAHRWRHRHVGKTPITMRSQRGPLAGAILALLERHERVTVAQLYSLLPLSVKRKTLRVQLHRLCRAGLAHRCAIGVYRAGTVGGGEQHAM